MGAEAPSAVVVCLAVGEGEPVASSTVVECAECDCLVWITQDMKANVLETIPGSRARCMSCAKQFADQFGGAELAPIPQWQRAELAALGYDIDDLAALAARWLNSK